ncbi:galactose oxidase [Gigaspora margarita]|uniref:Galactose oxidase n=1 Tax=Gigaspora margarita TaxID=4874 RepID=A0A8H4ETE7_GIGMA|nr:galactose oxidase [Gigaspora margarita]
MTKAFGVLWILDVVTYQWSIGNILNPIVDLALEGHTATLVDNYMLIAFGKTLMILYCLLISYLFKLVKTFIGLTGFFPNGNVSSKIFMLNVSQKDTYRWVTEFTQSTATTTTTTTTTITTSSSNLISSNTKITNSKNNSSIFL